MEIYLLKLKCLINQFIKIHLNTRKAIITIVISASLLYGIMTIAKTFYLPSCYGFEQSDELAHTFVDIPLAKKIISEGEFPLINLFNNFGSPIIGEPVSYPFAVHAISYYIFPSHIASTINRFIIAALTILVLTIYYREYFSAYLSLFLAVLVVSLPSFFHFLVHHPHQGAVFYFVLILLMQRRLAKSLNKTNTLLLFLTIVAFFMSVGIKGAHYAISFIALNQFFIMNMKFNKQFLILLIGLISAYIFVYPNFASFYKWAALSTRAYIDYPEVTIFSFISFIRAFFFFAPFPPVPGHIGGSLYFSLPVAILIISGFISLLPLIRDRNSFAIKILLLGIMPFLVVHLTELSQWFRSLLTIGNKPFDLASFWWFSNVYSILLVGYALKNIKKEGMPKIALIINIILALGILLFPTIVNTNTNNLIFVSIIISFLVLALYLYSYYYPHRSSVNLNNLAYLLIIGSLLLAFIPPVLAKTGLKDTRNCTGGGIFFGESWKAEFHPKKFIDVIEPYSRIASQVPPVPDAYDLWASRHNIFGSNGRSITIDWGLTKRFIDEDMIKIIRLDQTFVPVYYITSQDTEKLSLLGIKYIIANKELSKLINDGWEKIAYDSVERLHLYKNPNNVSLVYFLSGGEATFFNRNGVAYKGNSIYVKLPEVDQEMEMVATFTAIPGWKAYVNRKPRELFKGKDQFLHIRVKPGDKSVVFKFEPYSLQAIIFFPIISAIIMAVTIYLLSNLNSIKKFLSGYKNKVKK